jgi:hypothetical protein
MLTFKGLSQVTDTIYVSYTKSAYLIFDAATTFDVGSEDVIVKNPDNKIIIQAAVERFQETNLLVQCKDEYYLFILKYDNNPKKLLYNYQNRTNLSQVKENENESNTISNKAVLVDISSKSKKDEEEKKKNEKLEAFKNNSLTVIERGQEIMNRGAVKGGVKAVATNFCVSGEYYYLKLVISNDTKVDYDIDFVRFQIANVKRSLKKEAEQEILIPTVYTLYETKTIKGKSKIENVYVFDKFTVDKNKCFKIQIWEVNGERKLDFSLSSEDITNVKYVR